MTDGDQAVSVWQIDDRGTNGLRSERAGRGLEVRGGLTGLPRRHSSGTNCYGTGLGSALVSEGVVVPLELGHLTYRKGEFEDYVGAQGLARLGKARWQKHVEFIVARLIDVIHPDDVVLGGGNAKMLKTLPSGCRLGDNALAFTGGFRMWEKRAKE